MAFPNQPRDGIVPRPLLIEVTGSRHLRPEDHIGPVLRPHPARQNEQFRHDAVRALAHPLLVEALVRLDQADDADFTRRQRAHPPRPVAHREHHGCEHRPQPPPPQPRTSHSPSPHYPRLYDGHVAPRKPQRDAARAGEVGPLHQDWCVGQRRAEAQPREPDVAEVADDPLQCRPADWEHERQWQRGEREPHPGDEPEQQSGEQPQDRNGGEVAERRERGEVPEGDDHPVQHQPEARHAVPEAAMERGAGSGRVEKQKDGGGDGDEAQRGEAERRVAREEGERAQGGQGSRAAAAHRITSRPSSAER